MASGPSGGSTAGREPQSALARRTRTARRPVLVPATTRELRRLDDGGPASADSTAWLTGGGPAGNETLTAITAVLLLALLAVEGVTILRLGSLLSVHMFVGVVLVPTIGLKMASTGYRFARYYTGNAEYRRKGPPEILLRLIAPMVVATSVAVLATGMWLLIVGTSSRDPLLLLHKASFIVWLVFTSLHVLGHLPGLAPALRADYGSGSGSASGAGRSARMLAVLVALVVGVILAMAFIPDFAPWVHAQIAGRSRG